MNGSIYVIKNDVNDKLYVGQTVATVEERFKRHLSSNPETHNQAILWAIRKYGAEHFYIETLETGIESEEELNRLEEKYIQELNSLKPNGYNLCPGGKQWRNSKLANVEPDMRLVTAYLSGMSLRDVAAQYGCSVNKVKYHIKKSGNALRKNNNQYSKHTSRLTEDALRQMFIDRRMSDREISDETGFSMRWVRKRRQMFDIHRI